MPERWSENLRAGVPYGFRIRLYIADRHRVAWGHSFRDVRLHEVRHSATARLRGTRTRHVARKAGLKLSNSIKRSVFTFFPDRLPFYHIFHMDMDDGGEGIVPFRWRASSRRVGVRAEHQRGRPGGMPEPPVTICLRLLYRRMQLMQLSMLQLLSHSMRRVLDGKHLWQLLLHV